MPQKVKPVLDRYSTVTPYIVVDNAEKAIEFYQRAFGAEVVSKMPGPKGKLLHAEIKVGNSIVMLSDEFPHPGATRAPKSIGGATGSLHLYVSDVDALFNRAVTAGAKVLMPISDTFWGDRYGTVTDPFGHAWGIATHIKDLSPEEMKKAAEDWIAKNPGFSS